MSSDTARSALSEEELDGIEKRCNVATSEPWSSDLDIFDSSDGIVALVTSEGHGKEGLFLTIGIDVPYPAAAEWTPDQQALADAAWEYAKTSQELKDARFVAAARTDVPRLLAEVRRLRTESEKLGTAVVGWATRSTDDCEARSIMHRRAQLAEAETQRVLRGYEEIVAERDAALASLRSTRAALEEANKNADRWRQEFEQQAEARRQEQGGYPGRLSDVIDEAFGLQPPMPPADLITRLERGLFELRRERDEARAALEEARRERERLTPLVAKLIRNCYGEHVACRNDNCGNKACETLRALGVRSLQQLERDTALAGAERGESDGR